MIIKENSEAVVNKLTGLLSIRGYRLDPLPTKRIRDIYFDNAGGDLRKRRTNLRIREIDDATYISVKSNTRRTLKGAIMRKEVEVPWTRSTFESVLKDLKLERHGGSSSNQFSDTTAVQAMEGIGLRRIQDRETMRQVRNISAPLRPGTVLAELAIDLVTYHIRNHDIAISEVEVEEKASKSSSVVRDVTEALIEDYKPALQKWGHGKLVTGLALQKLVEEESEESLLDHDRLKPDAFDKLDQAIRSGRRFWVRELLRTLKP